MWKCQALTNALYDLATHPEYAEPMRNEVVSVLQTDGWTKASMGKMRKVDSFIKESQRLAIGSGMFASWPVGFLMLIIFQKSRLTAKLSKTSHSQMVSLYQLVPTLGSPRVGRILTRFVLLSFDA